MTDAPGPLAARQTLVLRMTRESDLDVVLAIARHPDNSPFIGQWSVDQHLRVIRGEYGEHWVVTDTDDTPAGFLMAYDLTADGYGVWVQRIAVASKSLGIGRAVLSAYLTDALPRFGADIATLDVMSINERAQRAYCAVGFEEVDLGLDRQRLDDLLGGLDEDGIIMQVAAPQLRTQHRAQVRIVA